MWPGIWVAVVLFGAVEVSCGIGGLRGVDAGSSVTGESAMGDMTFCDGLAVVAVVFRWDDGLAHAARGGT